MRRFLLLSLLVISTCAYAADDNDSLTATVTRMARIGRCTSPQFSPDGKTRAFRSDMSGVPQVWTVPVEGGWPHQIPPSMMPSIPSSGLRRVIRWHFPSRANGQRPIGISRAEWFPDGKRVAFYRGIRLD